MLASLMEWLFSPLPPEASVLDVIVWWEKRRIPCNLIVGAVGFVSLIAYYFLLKMSGQLEHGEDAVEPFALLLAPIAINLCYTLGWFVNAIVKLIIRSRSFGVEVKLFTLGLGFSLFVVILPAALWLIIGVLTLLRILKPDQVAM